MRRLLALGALLAAAGGVVACNQILGYDSATLDPSIGADAAASGGDAGADSGLSCENYCALVQQNCTVANAEYITTAVCLAMCQQMEPGFVGELPGQDSVKCREDEAIHAATDPSHCPAAGPLGGGKCGADRCNAFCQFVVPFCATSTAPPYTGQPDCRLECATYAFDADAGDIQQQQGDTLNCRTYHIEAAYQGGSAINVHCPHTGKVSATCN